MISVTTTYLIWRNVNSPNTPNNTSKPTIDYDKKWILQQLKTKLRIKVYF